MTNELLAEAAQDGNKKALQELWRQTENFFLLQARLWFEKNPNLCRRAGVTAEDLQQESFFAFLDSVNYYDKKRVYKFLTYAKFPLRNRFKEACGLRTKAQEQLPLNRCISLSAPTGDSEEDGTLEEIIESPQAAEEAREAEERIYTEQLRTVLEDCLAEIPENLSQIIRCRYYEGLTLEETGKWLGITLNKTRQKEHDGLRKLRTGKNYTRLKPWQQDIIDSYAYQSSFTSWKYTGDSSTERAVLKLDRAAEKRKDE